MAPEGADRTTAFSRAGTAHATRWICPDVRPPSEPTWQRPCGPSAARNIRNVQARACKADDRGGELCSYTTHSIQR